MSAVLLRGLEGDPDPDPLQPSRRQRATSYTAGKQLLVDSVGVPFKVPGAECQIRQQVNNGSSSAGLVSDHSMPNNKPINSAVTALLLTAACWLC